MNLWRPCGSILTRRAERVVERSWQLPGRDSLEGWLSGGGTAKVLRPSLSGRLEQDHQDGGNSEQTQRKAASEHAQDGLFPG